MGTKERHFSLQSHSSQVEPVLQGAKFHNTLVISLVLYDLLKHCHGYIYTGITEGDYG